MDSHTEENANFTKLRVAFMGTPEFAIPTLDAIVADGHDVLSVHTRPPARSGRGSRLVPSPVHRRAEELGIRVLTPDRLRAADVIREFAAIRADIGVVAAYGHILPRAILDAPRLGCLNVHGSLLPRWRGAAPIQRAILAGDATSGATIIAMDPGMDTGDVVAMEETCILGLTAGEAHVAIARIGARLISRILADPAAHGRQLQPTDGVTIASKIDKDDARIDFTRSAADVERAVRAFNPAPGAWTMIGGERVKVHRCEIVAASGRPGEVLDDRLTIACGTGAIRPTLLQRPGRGPCSGVEIAHAMTIVRGSFPAGGAGDFAATTTLALSTLTK